MGDADILKALEYFGFNLFSYILDLGSMVVVVINEKHVFHVLIYPFTLFL